MENFKEESRKNYTNSKQENATLDQIQTGCLQRIADSLEKIEKPYEDLLSIVNYYRRRNQEQNKKIELLSNQNRGLKAAFTRLKNKK